MMVPLKTLQREGNQLASPAAQRAILGDPQRNAGVDFRSQLRASGLPVLSRDSLRTLQINVGKVCNQTCSHCHVDAGPDRRESMSRETAEQIIAFLAKSQVETLDITGGAPEMNPHFCWLVEEATRLGRRVIDRCNLTILLAPRYAALPAFLAEHSVNVVASLPCYLEENCDAQRGDGVFEQSIAAIRILNELGYATSGSDRQLDLVYNPVGSGLPPEQAQLESEYRQQLGERYGVRFNNLLTITNMPISRFLDDLLRQGKYEAYMQKLVQAYNPEVVDQVMCRTLLSVDWNGYLFDCDFNQMLDLPLTEASQGLHITDLENVELGGRSIAVGNHCFGCTAGRGSSCLGSLT